MHNGIQTNRIIRVVGDAKGKGQQSGPVRAKKQGSRDEKIK
jgi:hypothetical protein